ALRLPGQVGRAMKLGTSAVALVLAVWIALSAGLIIFNAKLLNSFRHPILLTCWHQFVSVVLIMCVRAGFPALVYTGDIEKQLPPLTLRSAIALGLPVAVCQSICLFVALRPCRGMEAGLARLLHDLGQALTTAFVVRASVADCPDCWCSPALHCPALQCTCPSGEGTLAAAATPGCPGSQLAWVAGLSLLLGAVLGAAAVSWALRPRPRALAAPAAAPVEADSAPVGDDLAHLALEQAKAFRRTPGYVMTPDFDDYGETTNPDADVMEIHFVHGQGGRAGGIPENRVYRFRRLPTAAEIWSALRRGAALGYGPMPAGPFLLTLSAVNCAGAPAGSIPLADPAIVGPPPGGVAGAYPAAAVPGVLALPGAAPPAPPAAAAAPAPAAAAPAAVAPAPGAAAAPAGRAPAVPDTAAVAPQPSGEPAPGWHWVAAEDVDGAVTFGAKVAVGVPGGATLVGRAGRRGLLTLAGGAGASAVLLQDSEIPWFTQEYRGSDARTLEIPPGAGQPGGNSREWREVVQLCREEAVPGFGVAPPRTAQWCAKYQVKEGGPVLHHEMWKSKRRLNPTDFGVDMHETISKMIEAMGSADHLDVYNLASAELGYRKLQLIEHYWDDRSAEQQQHNMRMPLEEAFAFMGGSRSPSMARPELLDSVSKELERIHSIKKNARKLREEQKANKGGRGELVAELVVALNQLDAGSDDPPRRAGQEPNRMQQLCLEHLADSCAAMGSIPPDLSTEVALRELQVGAGYSDGEPVAVAPFAHDLVSLPAVGGAPVPLSQLLGDDGPDIVRRFITSKVLPIQSAEIFKKKAGFARPYLDPVLRQPAAYLAFVERMRDGGMLEFRVDEGNFEEVGLFTVWKKDGRQRLVIDCRGSNFRFAEPDKTSLASGGSFSSIELAPGEVLWTAGVDIADAFYNMGLPPELRHLFALPRLRAAQLGVRELGGRPVPGRAWVRPCLAVLPMGWTHALDFCQKVHRNILLQKGGFENVPEVVDGMPTPPIQDGAYTAYVDKFISFGVNPDRPAALLRRPLLAVFSSVYAFSRKYFDRVMKLPPSVRRELRWAASLIPLAWADLRATWSPRVYASDASEEGRGVCQKEAGLGAIRGAGRHGERWRFRRATASRPRDCLFEQSDPPTADTAKVEPIAEFVASPEVGPVASPEVAVEDPEGNLWKVPEVEEELYGGRWQVVSSGGWARSEKIIVLEGRALVHSLRHALRDSKSFGKRILFLCDNMGLVCAMEKGRSSAGGVLRVARQWAAWCLAGAVQASVRWIPSERNVADAPSRRHIPLGVWLDSAAADTAEGFEQWAVRDAGRSSQQADCRSAGLELAELAVREPAVGALRGPGSLLQRASVTPKTVAQYDGLWQDILRMWLRLRPAGSLQAEPGDDETDFAVASWMDQEYSFGELAQRGTKGLAAVKYFRPQFAKSGGLSLPRSAQALKGWKRLAPRRARLPLPWEVVALIALELLLTGFWAMAAWTIITFHCYLRPSELQRVTAEMLVPPVPGTHVANWAIVLHPSEEEISSKTREFDETVVFDLPLFHFLVPVLAYLKRETPAGQPLFAFRHADLVVQFREDDPPGGAGNAPARLGALRRPSSPRVDAAGAGVQRSTCSQRSSVGEGAGEVERHKSLDRERGRPGTDSVAFCQMIKAFTPASVYASGCLLGTQQWSIPIVKCLCVITLGLVVTSLGELNFHLFGFVMQVVALICEGLRITLLETRMKSQGYKLNALSSVMVFAPMVCAVLFVSSLLFDRSAFDAQQISEIGVGIFSANAFLAFLLNVVIYLAIQSASGLDFALTGVLKDLLIVVGSCLFQGGQITTTQLVGYSLAMVGLQAYGVVSKSPSDFEDGVVAALLRSAMGQEKEESAPPPFHSRPLLPHSSSSSSSSSTPSRPLPIVFLSSSSQSSSFPSSSCLLVIILFLLPLLVLILISS
ncbi:unnamed protein product, partial [Prorocentrum cordatum]